MAVKEAEKLWEGVLSSSFYKESLSNSIAFRKEYQKLKEVIKSKEMAWEESPQGLIKHVVNSEMGSKEFCLDIYQQIIPPAGRSGKHRHIAEEVFFVLEGSGYDLHWDVDFDVDEELEWSWREEPKKFFWSEEDFVYIPPYTIHQHFNADEERPARILTATNRILKAIGLDWIDQIEEAPPASRKKP